MSLSTHCIPRQSVYAADRRATVLSLDEFLNEKIRGDEFFEENYFTAGMSSLIDGAFRHLSGHSAGSSIFQLSQSMGGGKTHSMIGLGLLARDPALRSKILDATHPGQKIGRCRVIGFNGRNTDRPGGIWGDLAAQLGREEKFKPYVSPLLNAPGPTAWQELLGGDPTIIFLDELPPYLAYAVAVPVGNSDLSVVTTAALANLFVAVAAMPNVCLVLSDLAGKSYSTGQIALDTALTRAQNEISAEAQRIAVPLTPVNPNGDELYLILRKRLFEKVGDDSESRRVAGAYRDALREAHQMGLTSTQPDTLFARVQDAYPFHPDFGDLIAKFKENEGFQQTRGVIRLMQMLVADLWQTKACERSDLLHPYDLNLNNDEIGAEIRQINPALSSAIAHDIAHGGTAEVEQIDQANANTDASDAARILLLASLATTPGAIQGMRKYQLVDCLQRPGRDLSTFENNVMVKLDTRAWYLHKSNDERMYFKNQQNLAAKLRATASGLHNEVVDRKLRERLAEYFAPNLRDCYQGVQVLPPQDEVHLEQDKTTLVVVRPGNGANQLPISSDWQAWWEQQVYKNRVLFVSGSRDTYQKVLDVAREARAIQSIQEELKADHTPDNDPQWGALEALGDRVALQFSAALKEAFDQLVYPSINNALRGSGVELAFAGNQNGETIVRRTLESLQKFTAKTDDDGFIARAEQRLFGAGTVILWSDFKRTAAVTTNWPLHRPAALEELKAECLRCDRWREEGNHVRRGPFPPPVPAVDLRELSEADGEEGVTYLRLEPLHAPVLVYETGSATPTRASAPVPTPTRFEASGLRYSFLAFDPNDQLRMSEVREWSPRLRLKHQLHRTADGFELELLALPKASGIQIRYTTDGSAPTNSGSYAVYDGRARVPANTRVLQAVAVADSYGLASEVLRVQVPQTNAPNQPQLDLAKPATWRQRLKLDDAGSVWTFLQQLEKLPDVTAHDLALRVHGPDGNEMLEFMGSLQAGYTGAALSALAKSLQALVPQSDLRLACGSLQFPTGQMLLDWLRASNQSFDANHVVQ